MDVTGPDSNSNLELEIRRATHDDYDAVVEMVSDVWADRGGDYLPDVYHDWLEDDESEEGKKTFVAEVESEREGETAAGDLAGIVQAVMLSPDEAWFQSMRVNPDYRRMGVSRRLNEACIEWARDRDATVGRIMVFSWNVSALAAARAGGFRPLTEFRWARPEPDADTGSRRGGERDRDHGRETEIETEIEVETASEDEYTVSSDPAIAWRYWTDSAARDHLRGLALSPEETWALRELTREDLTAQPTVAVTDADGACAMAVHTRTVERPDDEDENETRTWAEYGVAAWEDVGAAHALFAAIARDAADRGADETRVCIPETAETVSDAAHAGADLAAEPDFVLEVDLTAL